MELGLYFALFHSLPSLFLEALVSFLYFHVCYV